MTLGNQRLVELATRRLDLQRNYQPKLNALVDTCTAMQNFSRRDRQRALNSIDALIWKMTAAGLHLERLWDRPETQKLASVYRRALNGGTPDTRLYVDSERAFLQAELDAFLFQARAFIQVVQVHTLDACQVEFHGMLTNDAYASCIDRAPDGVKPRLAKARQYINTEILGEGKWGDIVRSLRDRNAHFDRIRPTVRYDKGGSESLTVAGKKFWDLCQGFENGSYDALRLVIAPVWQRKWIAGPYRKGMWE